MDQKKGKSRIRGVIILVLLAVMLVSGAMSIHSWIEDKRTREEYERLAELARETTAQPSTEAVTEPGTEEPETEPYVSPINFEELMRENPDTIGWIRVPDTNIDSVSYTHLDVYKRQGLRPGKLLYVCHWNGGSHLYRGI